MMYLFLKAMHLIAMVAWFAGLFYLVRLFVYHTEAYDRAETERKILCRQYHIMEDRLHRIICQPAFILTWVFGLAMIVYNGMEWFSENYWLHLKIFLVLMLSVYHLYNKKIIEQLKNQKVVMSSFQFRLYNEVPTLFLLSIVLLAVFKNLIKFGYIFGSVLLMGLVLFLFAKYYKTIRSKSTNHRN